jgi:hypothetical protein
VREIAGNDDEIRVRVTTSDIAEAEAQAFARITIEQRLSGRHQVKIGDLDQLHCVATGTSERSMSCPREAGIQTRPHVAGPRIPASANDTSPLGDRTAQRKPSSAEGNRHDVEVEIDAQRNESENE